MEGGKSKDGWSCRLCGATTTRLRRHDRNGLDCCNICYCQQRRQIVKEQKERQKLAGPMAMHTCPATSTTSLSAAGAAQRSACAPRASKEAAKSMFRGSTRVHGVESSSCSSGDHFSPRGGSLQRPGAVRFDSLDGGKSISESVSLPEPRLSPRHAPPGVQVSPPFMAFPRQLCRKRMAGARGRVINEELWLRMARLRSQQQFTVDHSTPPNVRRMALLWAVHSAFRSCVGEQRADPMLSELQSSSSMDCTPVPQQLL